MKKCFLFISLLALTCLSAQEYVLEKMLEVPLDADQFYGVDDYGATYFSKEKVFYKIGRSGDYQFTALQLGKITSVDILNPLKVTLFYEGSNTALILDNTLSEITRINFSTIENFRNVSHATTASDRKFWIFNTDLQQLEIFDWNTEKVITQFPPMKSNAVGLVSNFNFAWVSNEDGVFNYNNYGSYLDQVVFPETLLIAQDNGTIIAFAKAKLHYKPKNSLEFSTIDIPDLSIKQLSLRGEIIYLYDGQKLTTFRLKLAKKP